MSDELIGVKNIIFDLGGVILNIDYQKTIDAFEELGVSNFDTVFSQYKQSEISDKFEKGEITENDFHDYLCELSGVKFSFLQFKFAWNALLLDLPAERINELKGLRENYRLFLFSNTNETHFNEFGSKVKGDFDFLFEKTYYSHQFGRRKPDVSSFQTILEENNLEAEETLFVDDSFQHIESAKTLGLKTNLIENKTINQIFI